MKTELSEDTISMFLGLVIVVVAAFLVISYVRKNKGNIDIPGVSNSLNGESVSELKEETTVGEVSAYKVEGGDSLWSIAVKNYGDGFKWVEIAKANKITNPDLLYKGQELVLPEAKKVELPTEYVVVKGDNLWGISLKIYQDGYRWVDLWQANKTMVTDPDKIEIGMKLAIPKL